MAARAIATAAVSFGLVSIPIKMFTTMNSGRSIQFNQLDEEGSRVKQQLISAKSGEVVPRDKVRKGYEFAKGQYVVFSAEELAAMDAQASHAIEIAEFVPLASVDPIFYEKSYYLGPDKGGAKAYRLLLKAMQETARVAIGKYASRGKSYLVMLRPLDDHIVMGQLYYGEDVRPAEDVEVPPAELKPAEVKLAIQLIDQVTSEEFDPSQYRDEVRDRIMALIERKVAGEEITVDAAEPDSGKVIDLMDALKASLSEGKKPAKRATAKADKTEKTADGTAKPKRKRAAK